MRRMDECCHRINPLRNEEITQMGSSTSGHVPPEELQPERSPHCRQTQRFTCKTPMTRARDEEVRQLVNVARPVLNAITDRKGTSLDFLLLLTLMSSGCHFISHVGHFPVKFDQNYIRSGDSSVLKFK
jgi:hypothetical protein